MEQGAVSLPKRLLFEVPGSPRHLPAVKPTTPGAEQTLLDEVVPANMLRVLYQVWLSCKFEGWGTIWVDSVLVGSGRTGPGVPNFQFTFFPGYRVLQGQHIVIKFTQRPQSPADQVECFAQCSDIAQV